MKPLSLPRAILFAFAVQILVIYQPIWAMPCAKLLESSAVERSPSVETLGNRVFAVHALRFIPRSEKVFADMVDHDTFDRSTKPPALVRFGMHFFLGELVRPHSGITAWESRTAALIKPLRELNNMVNLNPYDTYTIGGVSLTAGSILVLPKETKLSFECSCKIHFYDPKTSSLRVAVDQAIEESGGWTFRMKDNVNEEVDAVFQLEGREHLTSTFFSKLLETKPHISVGNELYSQNGHAFRLTTVTQLLSRLMKRFQSLNNDFGSKYYQFELKLIEHHLSQVQSSGLLEKLPEASKHEFENTVQEVEGILNIVRLDQHLRSRFSKTLINSDLTPELWANRRNLEAIIQLAEKRSFLKQLMESDQEPDAPTEYYALLLSTLHNETERASFIRQNKHLIPTDETDSISDFVQQFLDQ